MAKVFDVVIIGAGPSGLNAAKTFRECEPDVDLLILDSNATLGGVWAVENLYPDLKTNNLRGTLDFTDFPMTDDFGIKAGEHVSGEAMHDYLKSYAKHWRLLDRITFNTQVLSIQHMGDHSDYKWRLSVQQRPTKDGTELEAPLTSSINSKKIIVATGVTNMPHEPTIFGKESFGTPIIHSAKLGLESRELLANEKIQKVTVLGGGKSAYDAVYLFASAGRQVDWIIRRSGRGPAWVFPAFANIGPFKIWREKLTTTRFLSFFSPCVFGLRDGFHWIRAFLHGNFLGKFIAQLFWADLHRGTLADCGIMKDEMLSNLEPETSPFWYGTCTGVLSYSTNFYDHIKSGRVKIHRYDITYLSPQTVHLETGTALPADLLITATGFSVAPTLRFLPESLHSDLGIPSRSLTKSQESFWATLDAQADTEIFSQFPRLAAGPRKSPRSTEALPTHFATSLAWRNKAPDSQQPLSPFRLYRSIAPPGLTVQGDRSIAFIGYFSNVSSTLRLELTSLWAYAYLSGKLDISTNTVHTETALFQRFNMYRSPYGHGKWFPDMVFDQNPFFDLLLQDLGLEWRRKPGWGGWREVFEPYGQADYKGLAGEWLAKAEGK